MIRKTNYINDKEKILSLYKKVSCFPGGIARLNEEISETYISDFLNKSKERGLSLVAEINHEIIGEIHAYTPGLYCFSHILSDLTIVVHPQYQSRGYGKKLFKQFLQEVEMTFIKIKRIELIVRESNQKAIDFYKNIGFLIEGKMINRIKNIDNTFESDIPMAWYRK